ncbi:TrmB family transcriptional regulator [Methanosarcina sp. KYL-1]|uniref:TrmB family transcriptional regulator n=1 Tax=Methanosarcina sp. KYL-1 TaxID=2602068 RepID=UPI0021015532|nr:helix-turn-helix domain-containing protein [Methanosarcina sp. KYL-1]MCQ1536799.1 TrmB family transcriptional regulator [Methanosarcina sp. KYL-1]
MTLKLITNLQNLGFTENEARTYAALAGLKEATAREIFEASGVPRSKVYKVLGRMAKKGYIRTIGGNPTLFSRISPEELTSRIREDFMLSLDEVFLELHALGPGDEAVISEA